MSFDTEKAAPLKRAAFSFTQELPNFDAVRIRS